MKTKLQKILRKIIHKILFEEGFKYKGYIDCPMIGKIYDSQVWRLIKDHSRIIDRMSTKKMTEMSLLGQCILMRIFDDIIPEDPSWKFYGRNALFNTKKEKS